MYKETKTKMKSDVLIIADYRNYYQVTLHNKSCRYLNDTKTHLLMVSNNGTVNDATLFNHSRGH